MNVLVAVKPAFVVTVIAFSAIRWTMPAAQRTAHGGPTGRTSQVPLAQWIEGLPVKLDYDGMFRDVLAGRGLKAPNEYKR
jgi:hypothetical protein